MPDGSYSIPDILGYFEYVLKKHETVTDKPSILIYVNKIKNRITFKIKKGYYLELLTSETMKLLGSTKSKLTEDGNGKNVSSLEITEVVLIHCNVVHNSYRRNSRVLYNLFLINRSVNYWTFHLKILYFKNHLIQNVHILKGALQIKILILQR